MKKPEPRAVTEKRTSQSKLVLVIVALFLGMLILNFVRTSASAIVVLVVSIALLAVIWIARRRKS